MIIFFGALLIISAAYAVFSEALSSAQRNNNSSLAMGMIVAIAAIPLTEKILQRRADSIRRKNNIGTIDAWVKKMETGRDPILGAYAEGIPTGHDLLTYREARNELIKKRNAAKMTVILTTLIRVSENSKSNSWRPVLYNLLGRVAEF